jgi:thioredoxin reductase (NADPH)
MEKVVIVGSGPAGLTAAIYAARAALSPLVFTGMQPGGQLTTTSIVENYPGFSEGIDGNKLMQEMRLQAERMGSRIEMGTITAVRPKTPGAPHGTLIITVDNKEIETESLIVATGASALTLDLPNKAKLMGYGLSTCATCDGFFYRNRPVAVVGGGDSAMEEANYLAKLASVVTLVHRRDQFRASKAMQERVLANPKIKVIYNSHVVDTTSNEQGLTGIIIENLKTGERTTQAVDGLFMAIGHHPNTEFVRGVVDTDGKGYIVNTTGTLTKVPGIFAAGDVEDQLFRQAITAAGRGCQAALECERYLESKHH